MADDIRREETTREPVQERQGVREPQPLERGPERQAGERKVGDKLPGEGDRDNRDIERATFLDRARETWERMRSRD